MRSYWIRVGPNPMTCVLLRRGKSGQRYRDRSTEGVRLCEDRSRDCDYSVTSQGMPRTAGNHQKLEGKEGFLLRAFQRSMAFGHLDFRFLASGTMVGQISVVLRYPVCGTLLWHL